MASGESVRAYVLVRTDADLTAIYESGDYARVGEALSRRLTPRMASAIRIAGLPSLAGLLPPSADAREKDGLAPPGFWDPPEMSREDAAALAESLRNAWERRRAVLDTLVIGIEADESTVVELAEEAASDGGALTAAGIDLQVFAARRPASAVSDAIFSDSAAADRLIGAAALRDPARFPAGALAGAGVHVAVFDHGLDWTRLPRFGGGWAKQPRLPGTTIGGHGMAMARRILALAPEATLHDYAVLPDRIGDIDAWASDITAAFVDLIADMKAARAAGDTGPWVALNAWSVFERAWNPGNGSPDDPLHPLNAIMTYAIAEGCDVVFAAGNCGQFFPDPRCGCTDRGPGVSILGANAHPDVVTVASVRADGAWIGSSSQGPGPAPARLLKPDIAAPSHFRDADDAARLNTGTSTASAVTAGAIAALRQGWPALPPATMKQVLIDTAREADGGPGWSDRTGHGIIDLRAAVEALAALP
jgi:hypothetical protein